MMLHRSEKHNATMIKFSVGYGILIFWAPFRIKFIRRDGMPL